MWFRKLQNWTKLSDKNSIRQLKSTKENERQIIPVELQVDQGVSSFVIQISRKGQALIQDVHNEKDMIFGLLNALQILACVLQMN